MNVEGVEQIAPSQFPELRGRVLAAGQGEASCAVDRDRIDGSLVSMEAADGLQGGEIPDYEFTRPAQEVAGPRHRKCAVHADRQCPDFKIVERKSVNESSFNCKYLMNWRITKKWSLVRLLLYSSLLSGYSY